MATLANTRVNSSHLTDLLSHCNRLTEERCISTTPPSRLSLDQHQIHSQSPPPPLRQSIQPLTFVKLVTSLTCLSPLPPASSHGRTIQLCHRLEKGEGRRRSRTQEDKQSLPGDPNSKIASHPLMAMGHT